MDEVPKLLANKPKKEKVKQFLEQQQQQHNNNNKPAKKDWSSPSLSSESSSAMGSQTPPNPKQSFARRYKFLWPMLLTVNLAVGVYLFTRTKKNDLREEEEVTSPVSASAVTTAAEKPISSLPITELAKKREPIPEDQQRELFKWMLEEKRKVKPKEAGEKK